MAFNDKRVWFVTGTSSGLGKALLEAVLEAGERAVATARKPELLIQKLDVTVPAQITAAFEAVKAHFGRLDVVVNNAGYAVFGETEGVPDEHARKSSSGVQSTLPANFDDSQAAKFLREVNPKGHGGLFFNVSTAGGYSANPALSFYSASKFALEGFTEAFLKEMVPEWNIRGTILEPGGFETEWRNGSMNILPHPAYTDPSAPTSQFCAMLHSVPMIGDPVRMAKAILRLAYLPELPLRIQFGSGSHSKQGPENYHGR